MIRTIKPKRQKKIFCKQGGCWITEDICESRKKRRNKKTCKLSFSCEYFSNEGPNSQ